MLLQHAVCFYFLLFFNKLDVECPKTNPLRATITPDDQRSFIKCGILLKKAVSEIYDHFKKIAGAQVYSYRQVQRIYAVFGSTGRRMQTCTRGPEPTIVT